MVPCLILLHLVLGTTPRCVWGACHSSVRCLIYTAKKHNLSRRLRDSTLSAAAGDRVLDLGCSAFVPDLNRLQRVERSPGSVDLRVGVQVPGSSAKLLCERPMSLRRT